MTYCTQCGSRLEAGVQFCTACGARAEAEAQPAASQVSTETGVPASPQPSAASPWQSAPVVPQQQTPASTKSGCMPAMLVVLGVLALIAVLGIGGLVYAGYKVKQKATALLHNATPDEATPGAPSAPPGESKPGSPATSPSDDAGGLLDGLSKVLGGGDDEGDPVQPVNDATPVEPCAPAPFPPQSAAKIPLQVGTVVTTAWGLKNGDVENRITINSTPPTSFVEDMATEEYKDDNNHDWKPTNYTDTVCNVDLASANTYVTVTALHMPHLFHGVTRLRLSDKSFQEAKSTGQLDLRYLDVLPLQEGVKPTYEGGILSRVEPQDVAYPMIVNDQRVSSPCDSSHRHHEICRQRSDSEKGPTIPQRSGSLCSRRSVESSGALVELKDPAFSWWKIQNRSRETEFKVPHPVNLVEKQLAEQKRAIIYGIYFDFNKGHHQTRIRSRAETDRPGIDGSPGLEADSQWPYRQHRWRLLQPGSFQTPRCRR